MARSIDDGGWLADVQHLPSPNCDERFPGLTGKAVRSRVSLLVIHAISLPPGEFGGDAIERLFLNTLDPAAHPYFMSLGGMRVSAHFLIRRDGRIIQFVSADARAWHAGASNWQGRERCNDFSIGVELEGCDETPFADIQYDELNALIAELVVSYPITAIVGHSTIAPGRKTDPGPCFLWMRVNSEYADCMRSADGGFQNKLMDG